MGAPGSDHGSFRFHARDWLTSSHVRRMSLAERGAYLELLCYQWLDGFVPDSDPELAKLLSLSVAKWKRIAPAVRSRFDSDGARLRNERLESERRKLLAWIEKSRNGGRASGEARGNQPGRVAQPTANQAPTKAQHINDHSKDLDLSPPPTPPVEDMVATRAGWFVERYRELHQEIRGVPYHGRPSVDYARACDLVRDITSDESLESAVRAWLSDDSPGDKFLSNGTRTVAKFASRASRYLEQGRDDTTQELDPWERILLDVVGVPRHQRVAWLETMAFVSSGSGSGVVVKAPNEDHASWVRKNYLEELSEIAMRHGFGKVEVVV